MREVSADTAELLNLWERGVGQPLVERGVLLLTLAQPGAPPEVLANFSIGRRDASLLRLRENAFGPDLVGLATCPRNGERLELSLRVADLLRGPPAEIDEDGNGTLALTIDEYEVRFRLPTSLDLAAALETGDPGWSRDALIGRCLYAAQRRGQAIPVKELPPGVVDAVIERMADADPQADVLLALCCPSCGHEWQVSFDIVSFLWSEVDARATRVLREVHTLASAYGWSEGDVLAMSPRRRQVYLEMVRT